MNDCDSFVTLDGIVRARSFVEGESGKPFLGAMIECDDGTRWVIDYNEQTPFHLFANRRVLAIGQPYRPDPRAQIIIRTADGGTIKHFKVARLRVAEPTGDLQFAEVGPEQRLSGQLTQTTSESMLCFTTENGDKFLVANDPAGAAPGRSVNVVAYPVLPSSQGTAAKHLWIICPHSAADLWEWRRRHSS
jgi:hypothetical protein